MSKGIKGGVEKNQPVGSAIEQNGRLLVVSSLPCRSKESVPVCPVGTPRVPDYRDDEPRAL